MTLKILLASLLATTAPPGQTSFSVELAHDCAPDAAECEGARRSSFYRAWVRKESEATGAKRYEQNVDAMFVAAERVLCLRPDGTVTCVQTKAQKRWTFAGIVSLAAGIAIYESGLREDVAVGRGFARKCPESGPRSVAGKCGPSDDGGQGRGPSGERCAMQVIPSMRNDDALLGNTPEALTACYEQGMRMLVDSRQYCSWAAPKVDPTWSAVSYYGTGRSCDSINGGKTRPRVELARKLFGQLKRGVAK